MSRRSRKVIDTTDELSSYFHKDSVTLTHTHRVTESLTLSEIKHKNYAQETVFESLLQGRHLILAGSAGTISPDGPY